MARSGPDNFIGRADAGLQGAVKIATPAGCGFRAGPVQAPTRLANTRSVLRHHAWWHMRDIAPQAPGFLGPVLVDVADRIGRSLAKIADQVGNDLVTPGLLTVSTEFDRMGTIEEGKLANLIVTDGNTLEIQTQVLDLFILGRQVSTDNKHKSLYEKYRARPRGCVVS